MLTHSLFVAAGIALLFGGGHFLVQGAVSLAGRMGLPVFVIAVVIAGFGTSMPEMVVSVQASLRGQAEIALGNIVGSNIANILLILGLAALLSPISVARQKGLNQDVLVMAGATVLLAVLMQIGAIGRPAGAMMLLVLAGYLIAVMRRGTDGGEVVQTGGSAFMAIVMCLGGLAALIAGAELTVRGATAIAVAFGVPASIIGLTIVAVGTSLPELATTVSAALRGNSDVAVGNVVGSNIFNILGIGGAAAIAAPLVPDALIAGPSTVVVLVATAILAFGLLRNVRFSRLAGAGFLLAYSAATLWFAVSA